MKKLFKAIRQNDFEEVQRIMEYYPECANCISKAPPKMDDGMSALQVAVKNGGGWHDTRIISCLLDNGADVNFMEDDKGLRFDQILAWPVLTYMVNAVYINATLLDFKYGPEDTKNKVDEFISVLARMLDMGADPNKIDNRLCPIWYSVLCRYDEQYKRDNDEYNAFLTDISKMMMDLMISHGANIYRSYTSLPKDDWRYTDLFSFHVLQRQVLINNLVFNRELSYRISEECQNFTERKWIDWMKPYYEKDNPYYGAVVSDERKQFFQKLEQLRDEEEKAILK